MIPVVEDTPEESAENNDDDTGDNVDEYTAETVVMMNDAPVLPEAEENKSSAIGGAGRHSVANAEPQALREAADNPVVHEVIDLFSGTVIDVHR